MQFATGGSSARLRGRIAVITGAAAGIGRATAELFAREGARLVLADVNTEGLDAVRESVCGSSEDVVLVTADVSRPEDARRAVQTAVDRFGRIDIAVANAGVIPLASVVQATPEDWDHVMAIDGRGMFLTCKYAIEQMLITGGGSIVCLSSISGMAGQRGQATYGPAKFVASGLTKHLAIEWADHGIRVNAVAPGTINTERVRQLSTEPGGKEYLTTVKAAHPMGRLGEPQEVANAILFLASDEASFITGAILPVDGVFLPSRPRCVAPLMATTHLLPWQYFRVSGRSPAEADGPGAPSRRSASAAGRLLRRPRLRARRPRAVCRGEAPAGTPGIGRRGPRPRR